jgi:predicted DNA-binding transcriptional regulator AlpA
MRAKRYLTFKQLRQRWGGVSHMFIERRLKDDPKFPKPVRFRGTRIRLVDEEEIEKYERDAVVAGVKGSIPLGI